MSFRLRFFNHRRGVLALAGSVAFIAIMVLAGWALSVPVLKSVLPSYITMKANTAIGFLANAAALALLSRGVPLSRRRSILVFALQGFVVVLASLTLLEYLAGAHFGVDEWLFRDLDGVGGRFPPGRLAPITAVNFLLIAAGSWFSFNSWRPFARTGQFLVFLAFLSSFQALVGYFTGVTYSFGSAYYTQMAVHTSVGFILIAAGFFLADVQSGYMAVFAANSVGGTVARRLTFGAIVVPPLVYWLQLQGEKAGWYDQDFGMLLRIMGNVTFLSLLVMRTARMLHESHLSSVELAARERAAQHSARLKAEFLANMSHEIRTPINGVLGMAQILLDTPLSDEQRDYARTIKRSGEDLLTIINDVLDFSKVEAGKLSLEKIEFELRELLRETVHSHAFAFRKKDIGLFLEFAGIDPVFVQGDPGRLRQILHNLIGNALKFTQNGKVTLRVSNEGSRFLFEVTDTGVGIPEEAQTRLFNAFEQADPSTTRRFGGSGLGLSICKKLVELMNGEIGIRSRPNEGACFWFRLPLEVAVHPVRKTEAAVGVAPVRASRAARILVADDNPVNLTIASTFLEKAGYRAHAVANGREALSALHEFEFDLVLMDCHMPEMDGYQATRLVRESASLRNPQIPILALTASVMAEERKACLEAGMNDHITKPVQYEKLVEKIEQWLPPAKSVAS